MRFHILLIIRIKKECYFRIYIFLSPTFIYSRFFSAIKLMWWKKTSSQILHFNLTNRKRKSSFSGCSFILFRLERFCMLSVPVLTHIMSLSSYRKPTRHLEEFCTTSRCLVRCIFRNWLIEVCLDCWGLIRSCEDCSTLLIQQLGSLYIVIFEYFSIKSSKWETFHL